MIRKFLLREDTLRQGKLDTRELEIFTLLARGFANGEITKKVDFSAKTVSNAIQTIRLKFGVERTADITLLAVKHGIIVP